jgi:MarR family transcriptional regulator, 2-MHQ and catechol-resistance regulon repressor
MPTHFKGTPEETLALDAYIKLSRATNSFEDRMLSHCTLGKLTISQFGVLEALYHLGPLCQGQLSKKLLRSTGNMTMVVDNLEKNGLVRRVRSVEDRRMISIELTPAGNQLIERVLPAHISVITAEISVLTPDEQVLLGDLCRKLGLGKGVTEAPPMSSVSQETVPDVESN